MYLRLAIQQRSATIPWDNAKESLLVMANCVETSMGGTSGAVHNVTCPANYVPLVCRYTHCS